MTTSEQVTVPAKPSAEREKDPGVAGRETTLTTEVGQRFATADSDTEGKLTLSVYS